MTLEKIRYDVPFEVTEKQFIKLMDEFRGVICGRKEDEKFYIKVWLMQYAKEIKKIINEI